MKSKNLENQNKKTQIKVEGSSETVPPNEGSLKKPQKVKIKSKAMAFWGWPIKIFVLALSLSMFFGVLSEFMLSGAGLFVSIVIIFILLCVSILFDMVGVAFTSCDIEPFYAMASKKVRGSKVAIKLLRNAEKVSSLCCDVIGDICGILSGAAGAAITAKLILSHTGSLMVIIATIVSASIAALTVFGKAIFKNIAINQATKVVLTTSRVVGVFMRQDKKEKKKD